MVRAESDGKYTSASRSARLRSTNALRSSSMPVETPSVTKIWRKAGIVERAVAPSSSGATGTSRQPRTVRPSSAAIVSIRETASSVPSLGRKAMPTAYAPAAGSSNPATSRRNASGTWDRMPAPSPESGSAPVAPRCSRLRSTVSACSTSA